ncbi:MAG: RnfABCDGE type electron transport complex subunit D [Clostridiales bacterium]|nr:RnfABCDGE type electron transport complex subunit D [Clostridiales bacterium]
MKRKQLAPHIHADQPAAERYIYVLLALLPAWIGAVFYYGIRVAILSILSMGCFFGVDFLVSRRMYPEQSYYVDLSSLVSGLLLVLMVPASTSVWAILLASLFGSLLVKQAFGGVGTNILNPALASRAFLEVTFPIQMKAVEAPFSGLWHLSSLLNGKPAEQAVSAEQSVSWMHILSGRLCGMAGVTSIVLLLLGLLILIERRLFRFEAPVGYFLVLVFGYIPFYWDSLRFDTFFVWLCTGGLLLVGICMLNDYSTIPMDPLGRFMFGLAAGLLTLVLYRFGNSSYAMIFPVLMMNMTTPIFDHYLRPRAFSKTSWYREVDE